MNRKRLPEYRIWMSMRTRCNNPRSRSYRIYGGRGIRVCERWNDFEVFLADVGRRPSAAHSLDRYPNPDGNYEPGNVRWATRRQQRENSSTVRRYTIGDKTQTLTRWCEEYGVNLRTVIYRLDKMGWSIEKALTHEKLKQKDYTKTPKGSDHYNARLADDDIREIRASKETARALAARFGVSMGCIRHIRARETWAHVY